VTSKSTDTSIRLYKGRSHYNEWAFIYTPPATAGGGGAPGAAGPGGRGQRGQQPGPPGRTNTGTGTFQPGPFPTGPSSPNRPAAPGQGMNPFPNPPRPQQPRPR
jgi:hypothetical protein